MKRGYAVEPLTAGIRRALRPSWAPTLRELLPAVERKLRRVVGRKALYMTLVAMERAGEVGTVGRAEYRRYVAVTGKGNKAVA